MSIIKLDLLAGESACDGKLISFRTPCASKGVTGVQIENTKYDLVDSKNKSVEDVFVEGAMVSVLLDTTNKKAYLIGGGGGSESASYTATLTTSGWAQSGNRYAQTVNVTGVTASTPVVLVDVALSGTDIDADATSLEAWNIVSANNVAQGDGTLTFYALIVPSVNIPVNVGVC